MWKGPIGDSGVIWGGREGNSRCMGVLSPLLSHLRGGYSKWEGIAAPSHTHACLPSSGKSKQYTLERILTLKVWLIITSIC